MYKNEKLTFELEAVILGEENQSVLSVRNLKDFETASWVFNFCFSKWSTSGHSKLVCYKLYSDHDLVFCPSTLYIHH